jgi:hypothetical protein
MGNPGRGYYLKALLHLLAPLDIPLNCKVISPLSALSL